VAPSAGITHVASVQISYVVAATEVVDPPEKVRIPKKSPESTVELTTLNVAALIATTMSLLKKVLAAVVTKTSKPEYVDELVRSAFAASVASAVVLKLDPLVSTSTTAKSESATPATLTNAVPKILAEANNATGRTARARKPNKHLRNLLFILITE
jgi:hypothetical protein